MKKQSILKFDEFIISYGDDLNSTFEFTSTKSKYDIRYRHLNTGDLFYNFQLFNGYMFLDNNIFYDFVYKKCYFEEEDYFFKRDFILFENHNLIEQKIKEGVNKMNNESDEKEKLKIENNIVKEIAKELNNYNFKNLKFVNGEIYLKDNNGTYNKEYEINDNILKIFYGDKSSEEGEFIQKNINCQDEDFECDAKNIVLIFSYGKQKSYTDGKLETEFDCYLERLIGREKELDEKNEKFKCYVEFDERRKEDKGNISIYYDEIFYDCLNGYHYSEKDLIILEINNKRRDKPGRILIKDINKIDLIYEINVKINERLEPTGIGIVQDYRNGEILIVNFDNNNILSHNLEDLLTFTDKEEFEMNKDDLNDENNDINLNSTFNTIINKDNYSSKDIINNMIETSFENNNLETLTNKINEKIIEKKIDNMGIKDQKFSGECWAYSLSQLICMANARKYGRPLEKFEEVYKNIITPLGKTGKTNKEMEKIMKDILPEYGLKFEKIDENNLKDYLKRGIKCLATFDLKKKEWENFCSYFKGYSFNSKDKILTKEILEKPIHNIENENKLEGHSVILVDIDDKEDDIYMFVNSWGKNWGNEGKFKAKKECLKNLVFYAVYFEISLLKEEEQKSWDKLKDNIKNLLKEMKSIKCPICKRSARIDKFDAENENKLKCPFETECVFEIENDNCNDNFDFIASQLFIKDFDRKKNKKNKFDYGF